MTVKFISLFCAFVAVNVCASTVLDDSFETITLGSIDRQNGWVVESGSGDVQTNVVCAGERALEILNGSVSHSISNSKSATWTRFQAFVTEAPDINPTVVNRSTSVAFFINTQLTLTVYSNTTPVELDVPVPTNAWIRFDVYSDYESMTWNLSMDGTTVAAGLPLYSDMTEMEEVQISNNGSGSTYVDDILIQDEEMTAMAPDSDSDGIPDWWELKHFDSITGCMAGAPSGNPGLSCIDSYIAGILPDSAEPFEFTRTGLHSLSWDAKPSRTYDVLWSTNLLAGFTPVATNLFVQSDFIDTTSNTNHPSGFYKLQVRVAP